MADRTASRIVHATLTAGEVDVVTLGQNYRHVEIVNRDGAGEIYARLDGQTPSVAGGDCEVLPAAVGSLVVDSFARGVTVVQLVSSSAVAYSVIGLRD